MNRRALALSLSMLLMPLASAASQTGNVIRGKVRNANGTALGHVHVHLNAGVGGMINQTVTNEEGDFAFAGLGGTSYTLTISHPGYQPYSEPVAFVRSASDGQPAEIKSVFVTLEAPPATRISPPRVVFVQKVPPLARAAYDRGVRLSRENRPDLAIRAYQDAIKEFARYFDAHLALGRELLKAEQPEAAIAALEAARQVYDKDDRVYACFGQSLTALKKFAVAAAAYNEASRLRPDEPQYPLMRAVALIDQARLVAPASADRKGLLDAAEADLARVFELSRKNLPAVRLQYARLYELRGDAKRAADELALYLRETPDAENAAAIREAIDKLRASARD
jgi:tetratricopeptide (TPR) repeat protein